MEERRRNMEKLKNKHDHALTNWLKVIIFALLMLAPFFSVASKCLYVACNKNAKDSYYGETINELSINYVNVSQLQLNKTYNFDSKTVNYSTNRGYLRRNNYFYIKLLESNSLLPDLVVNNNYYLGVYKQPALSYNEWGISSERGGSNIYSTESTSAFIITLKFELLGFAFEEDLLQGTQILGKYDYNNYSFLDNAFEYGVNQLTKTPAFAWTKNTAIYTPINAMTEGLGFTQDNNVIAVLLTYWSLLTAIYVLFDIIISLFVKITHLLS